MQPLVERIQLESGEEVLRVVRKHWFILFREIIFPILLFIIPIGLYFLTKNAALMKMLLVDHIIPSSPHSLMAILFFLSLWGLLIWMMLFSIWTDYYLDMWTITNRRIIAIDQKGLFRRVIASFRYERLQDINVEINGFIATMLDFGDIHAQTAGHDVDFKIAGVPNPRDIKALILHASDNLLLVRPLPPEDDKPNP